MKALIFNSGLGSRLGALTAENPKCMVRLGSGEAIFERQLRLLTRCGIRDFVVTTGPWPEQLEAAADTYRKKGYTFTFVANPCYSETNYIYSMWLARDYLRDDDFLLLHGDLVFDVDWVQEVLDAPWPSTGSYNPSLPLPPKDFKARIKDGEVREVSISIFDEGCHAFQAFYKLSRETMRIWLDAVGDFVRRGETGVYAENAANTVFGDMHVHALSYEGHFVDEVDNPEDLKRVSRAIDSFDFAEQPVLQTTKMDCGRRLSVAGGSRVGGFRGVRTLVDVLSVLGIHHPLVIAGHRFEEMPLRNELDDANITYERFSDFTPNPTYEQVLAAIEAFRAGDCDGLLSVGGGSAMDVAKCAKAFMAMPKPAAGLTYLEEALRFSALPHVAVPTTAGSGAESTHFAVVYLDGIKHSVGSACLQPDVAVLDGSLLHTLSDYQKRCTLLDAFCQAIESYWSRRSSEASRTYSREAIRSILENTDPYLDGDGRSADAMALAANRAGKAINLTTTTAAHALSYKLTSIYGLPHGHAVGACMGPVWEILIGKAASNAALLDRLAEIGKLMGSCSTGIVAARKGLDTYRELYRRLGMEWHGVSPNDLGVLVRSVNAQRLGNFPVQLSEGEVESVYRRLMA